eukprot:1160418-Amphidinium_carterae.1
MQEVQHSSLGRLLGLSALGAGRKPIPQMVLALFASMIGSASASALSVHDWHYMAIHASGLSESEWQFTASGLSESDWQFTASGLSESEWQLTASGLSESEVEFTASELSESEWQFTVSELSESEEKFTASELSESGWQFWQTLSFIALALLGICLFWQYKPRERQTSNSHCIGVQTEEQQYVWVALVSGQCYHTHAECRGLRAVDEVWALRPCKLCEGVNKLSRSAAERALARGCVSMTPAQDDTTWSYDTT